MTAAAQRRACLNDEPVPANPTRPKRKDVGAEAALSRWRERLYSCLHSRADALFDLTDAILAAGW
jgi:hypothetical protein